MKRAFTWIVAGAMGAAVAAWTVRAEPLKTEYPKPMFQGTPVPLKGVKLAPIQEKPWQFELPAGCVNLAKDKPVTASDAVPLLGELAFITDGDKSAEEGSYVEIAGGMQWVQIDLGKPAELHAVLLWHFHLEGRVYRSVVVQVSDDPEFGKEVKTIFNNDAEDTIGLGKGTDFLYIETNYGKLMGTKGVKGRYVRLYSKGNTSNNMNHYIEVEVWGK